MNNDTLTEILAVLKESRDLLAESRDLLKPSKDYFDERKRLEGLVAEREARAEFDRRLEGLAKAGSRRLGGRINNAAALEVRNGRIVVEIQGIPYKDPNPTVIGQHDGVWRLANANAFKYTETLPSFRAFGSVDEAVDFYLSTMCKC